MYQNASEEDVEPDLVLLFQACHTSCYMRDLVPLSEESDNLGTHDNVDVDEDDIFSHIEAAHECD